MAALWKRGGSLASTVLSHRVKNLWRSRSASGLVPRCFHPGACRGRPSRRKRDDLELLQVGCGAGSVGASSLPRYLEEGEPPVSGSCDKNKTTLQSLPRRSICAHPREKSSFSIRCPPGPRGSTIVYPQEHCGHSSVR